jgi:AcrR family transcriptional regulator
LLICEASYILLNVMSRQKRKYDLKVRAERQQETRRRIVEAATALHQEVGPARTTVAEIARRAGVQRLTVYNHFPEEGELFAACQGHFLTQLPLPDLGPALAHEDPRERVRAVLRLLYESYRARETMTVKLLRDRGGMPALDALMEQTMDAPLGQLADALAAPFRARGRRAQRLRTVLALALDFWTWHRLKREGLDDAAAADLMAELIAAASSA